jgi:hypothetical protein
MRTMLPMLNIHKCTCAALDDGKMHIEIEHILRDGRRHSSALDVRSFWGVY